MPLLLDKLILLLGCFGLIAGESDWLAVGLPLVAVTSSAIAQLANRNRLSWTIELGFLATCIAVPELCCFLPLLLYDMRSNRHTVLCYAASLPLLFAVYLEYWAYLPQIALLLLLALLLHYKTARIRQLTETLVQTRDQYAGDNFRLERERQQLRENQDNAVYLATLQERSRIARDIHDNVGHLLTRSILQVGALQMISDETLRTQGLQEVDNTLNTAMTTIRNSVHDLHNDAIDLQALLEDAVQPLRDHGIQLRCEWDFSQHIPEPLKLCCIAIVKESVSNILKYSNADRVTAILREQPAFYQLVLEDNGYGAAIRDSGIGLSNIKRRVEDQNGILNLTAGETGFRIFITIPKR